MNLHSLGKPYQFPLESSRKLLLKKSALGGTEFPSQRSLAFGSNFRIVFIQCFSLAYM